MPVRPRLARRPRPQVGRIGGSTFGRTPSAGGGVVPGGSPWDGEAQLASRRDVRGQSIVEFTLVLPILLLLLVTVADFGRYFATGIQIESAARTAAELAAGEYLRAPSPVDYSVVHRYAWQSVCDEVAGLPNASPAPSPGSECDGVPTIVCVHDGADDECLAPPQPYNAASGVPAQCTSFTPGAMPTNVQAGGSETSRYVEVRVCYRFSTIFRMSIPFLGLNLTPLGGDFFIERTRVFTVADY